VPQSEIADLFPAAYRATHHPWGQRFPAIHAMVFDGTENYFRTLSRFLSGSSPGEWIPFDGRGLELIMHPR
jgi:hypothetical protein